MFVSAYATLALAAVGSVSGLVVPRKEPPKGWLANILEDYNVYHTRYLALECQNKHGKPFFDQCCHPLLKSQSLSSRPAQCRPSASASASASAAEPTSTVSTPDDGDDEDEDDDCDDSDDETSSTEEGKTSTHAAATTHAVTTSTLAATTTKAATSTHQPTSTTTHSSATPSKSASSSSDSFTDGFATFFYQNGVAGACGKVHSDNDLIAAIDEQRYGNSGLKSSLCGKQVQITNPKNGKSVIVTIADDCPTCKNKDSIDLSVAAFNKIATEEEGMVNIKWNFIE